ncbi:hypothetical protein D7Z26_19555 [Cohnella endophytica]|uniref:SWIM-type domain-containing protein n=1 Tax=Cohnella endophytica TaxID=2419778 RepID=A0A494XPL8_9BACL|nr:hypothetical protein [Cohnella endophytica]RKP50014.1 hypothetical protein D7Z26_19555 [Cohnella endophytica]
MDTTYQLDDNQWELLVQNAAEHFDDVTLSRGFQYYKQGRVVKLTLPAPSIVKAIVEGSELYHLELNLDYFGASRCDCPVNSHCKHQFAALLKYADLHNRPVHSLVNAKTAASMKSSSQSSAFPRTYNQAKQLAAQKAVERETRLREQSKRIASMSVDEWHALFDQITEPLTQSSRNTQFVNDAMESILKYKPALPQATESFFYLHARLFVLSKLAQQPEDQSGYVYSYLAFHTHHAASDLQETIVQAIMDSSELAADPQNASLVDRTLSYLRTMMLAEKNDNRYFLYHYLATWCYWRNPFDSESSLFSEELVRLTELADTLESAASSLTAKIAQAAMQLYLSNDEEAWTLLESARQSSELPTDALGYFFVFLARTEQWERLISWLIHSAPWLTLRRNQNLRPYADYWEMAIPHVPEAETRMWDALASLLPHSRHLYEEKMLARGEWKRWMDYHLSMDSDPMDFRVTDLQPLEKNAPELLLPFYHQAVERYVLLKNRDGYKTAVKMMKRLAKLYKKLKQEPRWELFLDAFASRHSRLRALQEELRKGKLLP